MSYLSDIDNVAGEIPFGEIQLTLKRHEGKTTKVSVNTYDHKRFADNVEAASYIMQTIKDFTDLGESGSISFTLMLKSGKIGTVIQQGYHSKDYR
jgi:hypothetical protein